MAEEQTPDAPEAPGVEAPAADVTEAAAAPAAAAPMPAASKAAASASAETGSDSGERAGRKVREGLVVSDKMQATVVVAVVERVRHSRYGKTVQRTRKLYAHDDGLEAHTGDRVRVMETRPISKLKRWRVTEVLERAR